VKTDIYQKMERDFGDGLGEAIEQIELLEAETKGLIDNRLLRAILFLADGDLEEFKQVIELARTDYRDVLFQAEYGCGEKRLYDFNKSFHELKLMDK